ncbi:MAG TPA: SgcJ/EcaC family oxidoreductase [Syntrophobacteria bacterium]|nr:SgcJ/EcaC family oxidoreductase [Syntrophobacteria bacterium]
MKRLVCLFAALSCLLAIPALAQTPDTVTNEVQKFVRTFVEASNKADAKAVMEMYSKKPSVISIDDGKITRGWEAIRSDTNEIVGHEGRYKISLGNIEVTPLGPAHALAVAPYTMALVTEDGTTFQIRGAITVILEKAAGKWQIIHDHTSSQPGE